jgi:hypothetical protein
MQRRRPARHAIERIYRREPAGGRIVPPRPMVLHPRLGVIVLPGKPIRLPAGPGMAQHLPEGGVRIGIGQRPAAVRQRLDAAEAVGVDVAGLAVLELGHQPFAPDVAGGFGVRAQLDLLFHHLGIGEGGVGEIGGDLIALGGLLDLPDPIALGIVGV